MQEIKADSALKNRKRPGLYTMIFLVIALLVIGFVGVYHVVTRIIVTSNIENVIELAEHDKYSISTSIRIKKQSLSGWVYGLRSHEYTELEDVMFELAGGAVELGTSNLYLVDADMNFYGSDGTVAGNDFYAGYLQNMQQDYLIMRYDAEPSGGTSEIREQYIVIMSKINEFTVEGNTFRYVLEELSLSTFQNELKIDSYGGAGFSNIIDKEGLYVVAINESSLRKRENFFENVEKRNARIEGFPTIEAFRTAVLNGEELTVKIKMDAREGMPAGEYILITSQMEDANWVFISLCPISVFSVLTNRITLVITMLVGVIMITVGIAVLFSYRTQTQKAKAEADEAHRAELADALALAQQANRSKTTFLNNMSHDIRTPMNAIIGFTSLASTHLDDKETVRDYLSKISKSSEHLLSLINDVLDMSRIESGKMNIHEEEENLSEIFHSLRDIIQADINAKQINFFMDTVDVTNEDVICDKLRLNQVLLNITSNALKFTAPGGTISVRITEKAIKPSGYATYEFRIKDTGIGMSEEFAKTIFEPFTREQTSTVSGIQGTGLGMAITKNIVDMMGGTIEVHSKVHQGTEFIVTIDFKLSQTHKPIKVIHNLEGLRGLVVDDDINTCQSVSDMLRTVGMRAEWCVSGKESVVRTEEAIRIGDQFAVYVIDWLMPDMNGIETTRRIRRVVGNDAPIIILTAYDWKDIEAEAREAGVTKFISKPLFPSDLHQILMEACGEAKIAPVVEPEPIDFKGKRILLVEDNEINREIATAILTEAGFEIETAEDGRIGCDKVASSTPGYYDLVLMDIQMPVMDGYEATRMIRRLENKELANIPIIAMTANAFEEDKHNAQAVGMNGHISKPIDIPLLFETLKSIL